MWPFRRLPDAKPAPVPVIAVGSLSHGGSGKTPMVIALAQRLSDMGAAVHMITDGAGESRKIDARTDRAEEVGDTALLFAAFGPTWMGADPLATIQAAAQDGAQVVVLNNGLPDGGVKPAFSVLIEDAVRGFGNGWPRPFGPLKSSLKRGLKQADVLVTLGPKAAQARFKLPRGDMPPRSAARLVPLQTGMTWAGMRVYAFAGIGVPERFFATLHDLGAEMVTKHALTDHQELTSALFLRMEREAWARQAQMITTEKDAVRLAPEQRSKIMVLPVRLELDSWAPVDAQLRQLIGQKP